MAAVGFTPIQLYYSTTSGASGVPTAGNLTNGELAINITDGKLFYKDNLGAVQVIGTKGGVGSSSTTQVLYNVSGLVVGSSSLTFDGTILTAGGLAGPHNGTVGATTPNTGVFTTAKAIAAATQDSVILQGRAGGTSSYGVTLTPTTLTASRTLTLPDASGTILQSGTAVTIAQGGTGQTSASAAFNALSPITATGDLIIGNGTNSATRLAIGTNGYVLTSNGSTASWAASTCGVTSFQTSLSGLTPSTATGGAITLAGTLGATSGGTSQSTYTTGDILYASASNTLSKLPIGTSGQVLTISGGVPAWGAAAAAGVTTISFGSTGLTPNTATAGAVTVAGTLAVANGGTGVTSSTGSGNNVLSTSPTLVTPILGTPTSVNLTNATFVPVNQATGTLPIANGGTGQTTANTAFNALAPSQTSNSGKYLTTDGTNTSWATVSGTGTVMSVAQSFTGGIVSVAGSPITTSGTLALTVVGTSGGVPYFSSGTTWASSAALAANALVIGGGAGVAPSTLGSTGTTTTVLHGNASGAPTFGAVSLTADVTGNLPVGNLNSGTSASSTTFWRGDGTWATPAGGGGGPVLESYQTISSNYSVTAGSNAFSVGPVSVATGVAVTVPTGQVWLIAA